MNNTRLRYEINSQVVPGDRLGPFTRSALGPGTSVRRGHLYASTAGRLSLEQQQQNEILSVIPHQEFASRRVITVGQIVLAKVERVSWTQAHVSIYATEQGGTLNSPAEALLRREDIASVAVVASSTANHNNNSSNNNNNIHQNNKTSWQVTEAVRPGDWIVARVLSLGDAQRYMVTIAEPQLGVWYAVSSKGTVLQPKSWNTMKCPETRVEETRKCAKPRS